MAADSLWGLTPGQSVAIECRRRGREEVVAGCRALLRGEPVDAGLLLALGGPGAGRFVHGGQRADDYWLRVWAARGLLWAWDAAAIPELGVALADEAWRVREMALRVVARHRVGALLEPVADLREDHVPRVRAAAERALVLLTASGA